LASGVLADRQHETESPLYNPPQPQFPRYPQGAPPPYYQPAPAGKPKGGARKVFGILLIVFGALPLLAGAAIAVKAFINAGQQQSNPAFAAKSWHNLRTDQIFPDYLSDLSINDKSQGWSRQGIAKETSCTEAFRSDFAKSAEDAGCTTALRATYVDIGGTMAATIGIAVAGSYRQASDLAKEYDWAANPGPLVYPVAVPGTPAASWNKALAMSGGAAVVGLSTDSLPYAVAITVGPADSARAFGTLPGEWSTDAKDEKTTYWSVGSELISAYGRTLPLIVEGK
jgi:hypothetical protein